MSLAASALQICAVKALDGNINAKVYDSNVDPEDLTDEPTPIVVVYCAKAAMNIDARELFMGEQVVDFVLDFGIAKKVTQQVAGSSPVVSVEFPDNDSGHDLALHTLQYNCLRILLGDNGTWADLWRRIFIRHSIDQLSEWDRGVSSDKGVRLAILRNVYKIEIVNDPTPGETPSQLWNDVFTAMEGDSELADIGKYWRAMVTTPTVAAWRQIQTQLGLALDEVGPGTALAPLFSTTTDDAPASTQINVLDEQGELSATAGSTEEDTFTTTGDDPTLLHTTNSTFSVSETSPIPLSEAVSQNNNHDPNINDL